MQANKVTESSGLAGEANHATQTNSHQRSRSVQSTYHVITDRNKQIEEQQSTSFHFHLHRPAPLENVPAANNQR